MNNNSAVITTPRLILRRYREDDFDDLYEYLSDPDVLKYEPYKPMNPQEARAGLEWRISTPEMFAVQLSENKKMIGNVYLGKRDFSTLELGFVFNCKYWGQGYAKESCKALINLAFSQGTHRIYAECDPQNSASWHLLESLGFAREAFFKQNVYFWTNSDNLPIWKDTYIYSLLNPDL